MPGFLEYTDYQVGRIVELLEKLNILDDTLIYYIVGDNGASAEGGINGSFNEMSYFNGLQGLETAEYLTERIDKLGGPESYNHYAVGWAHAMNTPYQWTKQVASHWGGTRNGTVVHWPKGIKAKGEIRSQFTHVIDVAPTVLEAAGLPQPVSVNGIQQDPIEGISMLYSFNDAKAPEQHDVQYFEIMGNRGLYYKGWTAVTKHYTPWITAPRPAFDDDVWELYSDKDWSQANNLAKQMPEKLHELQRQWLIEAARYKVLPLDDRLFEKLNPDLAGRPVLIKGKTQLLVGGMGRLSENCVLNLKNKSHSVTAEIVVPEKGAEGVIVCQGANIGGWSLYAKKRQAQVLLQLGRLQNLHHRVQGPAPRGPAPGAHGVRLRRRRPRQGRQGDPLHRRQEGRRGERRGNAGDDLLRRRRHSMSVRIRVPRFRRTTVLLATTSTARSRACSSRSRMTRTIRITWSSRRTQSTPRWDGSKAGEIEMTVTM